MWARRGGGHLGSSYRFMRGKKKRGATVARRAEREAGGAWRADAKRRVFLPRVRVADAVVVVVVARAGPFLW